MCTASNSEIEDHTENLVFTTATKVMFFTEHIRNHNSNLQLGVSLQLRIILHIYIGLIKENDNGFLVVTI